jgi:hypothetical protein
LPERVLGMSGTRECLAAILPIIVSITCVTLSITCLFDISPGFMEM